MMSKKHLYIQMWQIYLDYVLKKTSPMCWTLRANTYEY